MSRDLGHGAQISTEYNKMKVNVIGNIVAAFVKMRRFRNAFANLQLMMEMAPSAKTAFHILLCNCILGQHPDVIKQSFQELIEVDLEVRRTVPCRCVSCMFCYFG